jgi:uncharacterized cofD-like protein
MTQKTSPRIVVIGGGTGNFSTLLGLKRYTPHLTALVSMADSGGSTGILRDELGVLPPGDVRKCLIALANADEMRDLFSYRFDEGSLDGHSFGNLFLTAVEKMTDNFTDAVALASKVLNITGRVLPVTLDNVTLVAHFAVGTVTRGEAALDFDTYNSPKPVMSLDPAGRMTEASKQAIADADFIVIAPGSLYTSLAAVLVVDGMAEALAASQAPKLFITNLITTYGQTDNFKVHDFADEIERFLDGKVKLDHVLYNTAKPSTALLKRYEAEGTLVAWDESTLKKKHYKTHGAPLISDKLVQPEPLASSFIRHDPDVTAREIMKVVTEYA